MFCNQCQETAKNVACTIKGVCGKLNDTSNLQDLLVYSLKGLALAAEKNGKESSEIDRMIMDGLFITITNTSFDDDFQIDYIKKVLDMRDKLLAEAGYTPSEDILTWNCNSKDEFIKKAEDVVDSFPKDEDIFSLHELIYNGIKGMAAYAHHADNLDFRNEKVNSHFRDALIATTKELSADDLLGMVLKTAEMAVEVMALLDKANSSTYGNPEISEVNIGVGKNPGILISGHDLNDMEALLKQTEGTGVDVYTHCEMLPANYYPKFKKYKHFVGNYGNSWWKQDKEFASFNGPIVMTSNCLVKPRDSYKDRLFTTGVVAYPGNKHLPEPPKGEEKDFSEVIELAKKCEAPEEIETGKIVGGFAHQQVIQLADKVVEAVKSGAIKKFVVMAGCDGRHKSRDYYTEFAEKLPKDTVILTAGCAKYRYNKLNLGDIGGIPRVLDAGQCNDSYSLAVIAMKLKEVFELNDINDLPIVYNIAWYEQKAVTVFLALLHLGVKNIHLGPTLPAFLSPNVAKIIIDKFKVGGITDVDTDMEKMIRA